jgi:hypothetical protein
MGTVSHGRRQTPRSCRGDLSRRSSAKTEAKRRRTTCNNNPASRLVAPKQSEGGRPCNCWRIPAPCYLLAIYRSLRGYPRTCRPAPCCYFRGLRRVTLLFTGLSGWSFSSSRVKWGARASRARRPASRRTLGVEEVRNGTLRTAIGTVALPNLMPICANIKNRPVSVFRFRF